MEHDSTYPDIFQFGTGAISMQNYNYRLIYFQNAIEIFDYQSRSKYLFLNINLNIEYFNSKMFNNRIEKLLKMKSFI